MGQEGQNPLTLSESGIASVKGAPALQRAGKAAVEAVKGMTPLQQTALATAPIPVVGDAAGIAADVEMYATQPEERTGLNYLMSAVGLLPFVPGAAQLRAGKQTVQALGKEAADEVTDLAVKFKSEHPAFENLGVSYMAPNTDKGLTRYANIDNPTGVEELGIIRVTAPSDDLYRASGGKYTGTSNAGHDGMFLGGEKGLSQTEISKRNSAVAFQQEQLIEEIMEGNITKGLPESFTKKFPSPENANTEQMARFIEEDEEMARWLNSKAAAAVREDEIKGVGGTLPKNTPVGFARFAEVQVDNKPYLRVTEIQSDIFADARRTPEVPEEVQTYGKTYLPSEVQKVPDLYPNMKKDEKPLTSAVLKGAVATAIERGDAGVILPNSTTSGAGVRYSDSNVKKLLNKTVKDLGEGYSIRKVEVPSYIRKDGGEAKEVMSEHFVLEWPDLKSAPEELKFATGGLVSIPPKSRDGIVGMIRKYRREGMMD